MKSISRRETLKLMAKGLLLGATPLSVFPQSAFGCSNNGGTIVVLFQRGGCDGIHMLPPKSGSDEYDYMYGTNGLRSQAPLPDALIDNNHQNSQFALHPAMTHIRELWQDKQITFFPATHTGIDLRNERKGSTSHFTGQAIIEDGGYENIRRQLTLPERGWISRALTQETDDCVTGLALGGNAAFAGDQKFMKLSSIQGQVLPARLSTPIDYDLNNKINEVVQAKDSVCDSDVSTDPSGCLSRGVQLSTSTRLNELKRIYDENIGSSTGVYKGGLGTILKSVAALIKGGANISFITMDQGGYDHHSNLAGRISGNLAVLSENLKAFHDDLSTASTTVPTVRVIVISEFGRTIRINKANGTDHGQASTPFVMSCGSNAPNHQVNVCFGNKNQATPVDPGSRATWPGYSELILPSHLQNYLNAITDYRDILYEVMSSTLTTYNPNVFTDMDANYVQSPLNFMSIIDLDGA